MLREAFDARLRVLREEHPDLRESQYSLGCLSASLGEREEALGHLQEAVSRGWAEHIILTDTTLDSLRGDPEFDAIVAEVVKRLGEQ